MTTCNDVARAVAQHYGILRKDLRGRDVRRRYARPRQIAMALAYRLTDASLPRVGRFFGGRHHATVLGAIAKIDALETSDLVTRAELATLRRALNGEPQ